MGLFKRSIEALKFGCHSLTLPHHNLASHNLASRTSRRANNSNRLPQQPTITITHRTTHTKPS